MPHLCVFFEIVYLLSDHDERIAETERQVNMCAMPYLHVRTNDSQGVVTRDDVVIVMLHTLWRNGDMYVNSQDRARYLPGVRVLAPDMLGHGKTCALKFDRNMDWREGSATDGGGDGTDENEQIYSIERHALAVFNSIVREVRPGTPVILLGYSVSAPIALCTAKYLLALGQYPVRAVVLVAPVLVFQRCTDRTSIANSCTSLPKLPVPSALRNLPSSSPSFLRNRLLGRGFATKPLVFVLYARLFLHRHGHAEEPTTTTNPDAVLGTIRSTLNWCPIESATAIRRSGAPVLILDGSKDALRANDNKRAMLLKLLGSASRRIVAPNSDHTLMAHSSEFVYQQLAQLV